MCGNRVRCAATAVTGARLDLGAGADQSKLTIPTGVKSENAADGATDYAKQIMAAYGQSFEGMPLRGKCIPLGKAERAWSTWPKVKRPTYAIEGGVATSKCVNPASVSPTFQVTLTPNNWRAFGKALAWIVSQGIVCG